MADQQARQDQNRVPALTLHTGTADTAETMRWAGSAGAAYVDLIGTEAVVVQIGTMTVGTIDLLKAGTISEVESGSVAVVAGTIGTVADIKLLHTLGTLPSLPQGSINVTAGTIGTVSNIGQVHNAGTVQAGSIAVTAGTVNVGTIHGAYDVFKQDASTEALVGIDYTHHEIHDGSHFFVDGFATVGVGTSVDFTVVTQDDTKWAHMYFDVQSTGQTEMYIYEASTLGTGGIVATPINSNRNSAGTSTLTIKQNQTISAVGNLLSSQSFGITDNPAQSIGGGLGRENELILDQGGTYLFRFTSRGNGNVISYRGNWYEHTSAN